MKSGIPAVPSPLAGEGGATAPGEGARRQARMATRKGGGKTFGFTLIELLIVIVIFAIFALMAYGGLDSVLKTRVRVEQALDRTGTLQKAFVRLRDDFQQLSNRSARDAYGDPQDPLRVDRMDRDGRVEFTRAGWRNPLHMPRATLERVSYRLYNKKLLRESWRVLDQAQDSKLAAAVLLDGVESAQWRFLDAGRSWQTSWPPETQAGAGAPAASTVPMAVEVTLETKDFGPLKLLFRTGLEPTEIPDSGAPAAAAPGGTAGQVQPPK
ncbi:MAG TPA: type II secretion system minor pseudopilin GspJ [Solimonas sp.]|nr:type II secretion system minor pseudopilin GspJ [Solimonas sp.]